MKGLNYSGRKRKIILNISFWSLIFTSIQLLVCNIFDITNYAQTYYIFLSIFFLAYIFLKLKYMLMGRILFFTNLNACVGFYCLAYGKNSGYDYFFTACIAMAFFLFSFKKEKVYVYIFGFTTFLLWLTIYISDFQLFNLNQIDESNKKIIYANNIFLLFLAIVIQLLYYTKNNMFLYNLNLKTKKNAEEEAEKRTIFLNTMSHEIRTPLNAINGLSYILKTDNPEKHQIEYINSLHRNGEDLILKLNNVLDYSKYQSDNFKLENESYKISEGIENFTKTIINNCEEKKLQFVLEVSSDLPNVKLDIAKLKIILNNLIRNAIKSTENGTVKLTINENTTFKKNLTNNNNNKIKLDFFIEDTGIGISKEDRKQILKKEGFIFKKDNKVGLGLAVVKNLLSLMDSQLNVTSKLGFGSTFYFSLLLDKVKVKNNENTENRKLDGKKVLLVDDNAVNIFIAKQILQKQKMIVSTAKDGLEAIEKAKKQNVDIILMDIQMPIMNGFEATKKIREFNKKTPIYALSASILEDSKKELIEYGFNGLLLKPFKPNDLIYNIKENIGYEA